MSLEALKEVLAAASETPDKAARSKVTVQKAIDSILTPIGAKIAEVSGPTVEAIAGHAGRTKPQFVAELRCEVPDDRELWIPQMRIALENTKKKPATLELGVTIGQAWTDERRDRDYPAHIRWGLWCLAGDKAKQIQGPFAIISRAVDGTGIRRLKARPVTNKPTFTLSMLGKMKTADELEGDFDALAAEMATDLMLLSRAILK